jgi:hypothetical protein
LSFFFLIRTLMSIAEEIMLRATLPLVFLLTIATLAPPAHGQQLVNKGVLVSQILARTRFGVFERGDLVHVTVRQPAGNKGLTLSVHAEYIDDKGQWQQVPPPKNMLALLYTSGNLKGLRDYVDINGVAETTERNVALFMPFNGYALEQGRDRTVRYVLRLWEPRPEGKDDDKEIAHLELEPTRVHVGHDAEGILITAVNIKPCSFLVTEKAKRPDQTPGLIRFFDTATGKWECPPSSAPADQAAVKR